MVRRNKEFSSSKSIPWKKLGEGVYEKILSKDDETGDYTRILKLDPGAEISGGVLKHEFFEEVYILEGSIADSRLGKTFVEGMHAFRNPGMEHGPYVSPSGCMTIEFRHYGIESKDKK